MVALKLGADAPDLVTPDPAHNGQVDLVPMRTAAPHAVVTPTSEKAPDAANVAGPVQKAAQTMTLEQVGGTHA